MNKANQLIQRRLVIPALALLASASLCLGAEDNAIPAEAQGGAHFSPALTLTNDPLFASGMAAGTFTNGGPHPIMAHSPPPRAGGTNRLMFAHMRRNGPGTNHWQNAGAVSSNSIAGSRLGAMRARMIARQLVARGITNQVVLAAMARVPRLLPYEVATNTFADMPVNIRYGRTVETPYVVASVAEQFDPDPQSPDRVLEIGTGSGYQTAVLSLVTKEVYSMETNAILAWRAKVDLQNIGCTNNVFLQTGDVTQGWPEAAPFDAIVVNNESPDSVSATVLSQLKPDGRLIFPVDQNGNLQVLQKEGGQWVTVFSRPVRLPRTADETMALPVVKTIQRQPEN